MKERRLEADSLIGARGAHIRKLFGFANVYAHIYFAGVFADDHTFIDFSSVFNKECRTFLELKHSVVRGGACFLGDQSSFGSVRHFAFIGFVSVEVMMEDSGAFGIGHEFAAVADESTSGHNKFESCIIVEGNHVAHFGFTFAEFLDNDADNFIGYIDNDVFERLGEDIEDFFHNYFGLAKLKLVAFAAHIFDKDCEMELSPAGYFESIGGIGHFDFKTYVRF